MSVTRNLQSSLMWTRPMLGFQPATFAGSDDPALTSANLVKQTILSPPFSWPWNRNEVQFPLVAGQQEYVVNVPDFGWVERVTLRDPTGVVKQIENRLSTSPENARQRPAAMGAQLDPGDGTITFRVNTLPDQIYLAVVQYQRRPVAMTSVAATWGPIPDDLAYIYEWGLLAHLAHLISDGRAGEFMGRFLAHLLSRNDALDATQRALFVGNWLELTAQAQRATLRTQQGATSRAQ